MVPPEKTEIMQLTVNVPPSLRQWVTDEIAQTLAVRTAEALHQHGYKAKVKYLDSLTEPAQDKPLLTITMIDWQTELSGIVDCTFAATLSTPRGNIDLGLFTGTSMQTFADGNMAVRSEQYKDAIKDALSSLYARISKTHLLST